MSSGESSEDRKKREKQASIDSEKARSSDQVALAQQVSKNLEAQAAARAASANAVVEVNFTDKPQKAAIYKWNNTAWELVVTCDFNPKELAFEKKVKINQAQAANLNVGNTSFGGGSPATLEIEVQFETTDTGANVQAEYTQKLLNLLMMTGTVPKLMESFAAEKETNDDAVKTATDEANAAITAANAAMIAANAPPKVKFVWGRIVSFEAYLTKLAETITFFGAGGVPLRSKVKLSFLQARNEKLYPPQNPTSRSAPRKLRVVRSGETLDYIAYQEYGQSAHWRHIAQVNDLADPRQLYPGQVLRLPPLPGRSD